MEYFDLIAENLKGNFPMELKEQFATNVLVRKGIPTEVAYLAVKGVEAMQKESFEKHLDALTDSIVKFAVS